MTVLSPPQAPPTVAFSLSSAPAPVSFSGVYYEVKSWTKCLSRRQLPVCIHYITLLFTNCTSCDLHFAGRHFASCLEENENAVPLKLSVPISSGCSPLVTKM